MTLSSKSFQTYESTEAHEFDINGEVFHLVNDVPGAVLLDFMASADGEDTSAMAKIFNSLFNEAIIEEDRDRFFGFIRDRNNHVGLDTLAEIAGFVAEKLSGGGKADQSSPPWPTAG